MPENIEKEVNTFNSGASSWGTGVDFKKRKTDQINISMWKKRLIWKNALQFEVAMPENWEVLGGNSVGIFQLEILEGRSGGKFWWAVLGGSSPRVIPTLNKTKYFRLCLIDKVRDLREAWD